MWKWSQQIDSDLTWWSRFIWVTVWTLSRPKLFCIHTGAELGWFLYLFLNNAVSMKLSRLLPILNIFDWGHAFILFYFSHTRLSCTRLDAMTSVKKMFLLKCLSWINDISIYFFLSENLLNLMMWKLWYFFIAIYTE